MKLTLFFSFIAIYFSSYCQTVTENFYQWQVPPLTPYGSDIKPTGCGSNSICAFGPDFYTYTNWGPLPIKATQGCSKSTETGTGLALYGINATNYSYDNPDKVETDGIVMAYSFKKGITYKISITADYVNSFGYHKPYLEMQVTNDYVTGTTCLASGDFPPISLYSATKPYAAFECLTDISTSISTQSYTFTATDCYSYLWLSSQFHNAGETDGAVKLGIVKIEELGSSYEIVGDYNFCTTSNPYSINNLPVGSTVTWSASPQGIVSLNQTGNEVTATRITDGNVTLIGTINSNGCISTVSRNVQSGSFSPSYEPIYGPTQAQCGGMMEYSVQSRTGASYNWSFSGNWTYVSGQGTANFVVEVPYNPGESSGAVNVTINEECATNYSTLYVDPCYSYYYYSVSPNPATSTVTAYSKQTNTKQKTKHETITELKIYDQQGNLKKRQKFGKVNKATININDLRTGTYILEIVDDNYKERQQFMVLR